jgi:hypothetical protein
MSAEGLSTDEVVVEAEYFAPSGQEKPSLSALHEDLLMQMRIESYVPENPAKVRLNKKSVSFVKDFERDTPSLRWKFWNKLGRADESELTRDGYFDALESIRDDEPWYLKFRLIPGLVGDENGIKIKATAEPAILHKHEQIERYEEDEFNTKNVVRSCKNKLNNIAADLEWDVWREPHTPAEKLQPTLGSPVRDALQQTKYGEDVIQFADEGDEALSYNLLHPALASYIHGIEWAIICYLEAEEDDDLIDEEISDEFGYYYGQLVNKIAETGAVPQKTIEELEGFVTYRRWMGHHKSGTLSRSNVWNVKQRLGILSEELFR